MGEGSICGKGSASVPGLLLFAAPTPHEAGPELVSYRSLWMNQRTTRVMSKGSIRITPFPLAPGD
jgi:hypothetical protein